MSRLSGAINGQKKKIIDDKTQKEEEILFLFSNPINNNQKNNQAPPKSVCEFILGQKLGEGTFGTVRLGENKQTGEKVAIKILDKTKMNNSDDKKRLEREINILKKIHHPNIVKLFCVIETDRQLYIIMEYIKGNELFQYILVRKKLEEEEACYFFLHIINCLDYLNKLKISHRDLKAENIIIEQNTKEIKIIDFGLSNTYENGQLLSTACGSPIYAAPEMLEGKSYKGSTVDIWSAGIVLYYMLSGTFPFEDISNDKLYKKILKGKFEFPKFFSKNVKDLIKKILVVNPKNRISLKDIKSHPWVLKYLKKNDGFSKIFKNIGLNIGRYAIPIDEDIVNEMSNKYKADKVEIRKTILYNISNDLSTLYYLILNKKCKSEIKSIADMKSDLFENYIKDKTNLLSAYNNDINILFEKRKNGPKEESQNTNNDDDLEGLENNEDNNNSQNDSKQIKGSGSYTNILNNENNNNYSTKNNASCVNNKQIRFINSGKAYNKGNQKIFQINSKNNKINNLKKNNYNQSLNLTLKKNEILNSAKKATFYQKNKIINKNNLNKNSNINNYKNNSTIYNSNKKYKPILQEKDNNKTEKKENINKNEIKKNILIEPNEINYQNKNNNECSDLKKPESKLNEEVTNKENKNISELNKGNEMVVSDKNDNEKKIKNIELNKNKEERNFKYYSVNESPSIMKNKKTKKNSSGNKNEELFHKKNATLITKPLAANNLNKEKDKNFSKKDIRKHKNKSMEIVTFNKNEINKENLKDQKLNIENNNMNKIKSLKNSQIKSKDSSIKPTNSIKNQFTPVYKPFDLNCLFMKNEKIIKNEIIKLSENKKIKIKNIKNDSYNINFKMFDLLVEITIEKINDGVLLFKIKKIKGNSLDFINQIKKILKELNIN